VTTTPSRDDDVLLLRAKLFRPLFFNKASFEKEQPFLALVFKDEEREAWKEAPCIVGIDIDDVVVVICAKEYTFYWNADEIWISARLREREICSFSRVRVCVCVLQRCSGVALGGVCENTIWGNSDTTTARKSKRSVTRCRHLLLISFNCFF